MTNPAPLELSEILTPEWLTPVLSATYTGARVASVSIVEEIVTVAKKVRFEVTYAGPVAADTPRNFCVKGFFGEGVERNRATGAAECESRFYSELTPHLTVRVPRCIHSGVDPETLHGIIVMEDLIPQGARFLTALAPYSIDQAKGTLDQLARLHAASWNGNGIGGIPWLRRQIEMLASGQIMTPERINELMSGPRGNPLPKDIQDGERIYAGLRALNERLKSESQNLVHGDCHAGNVFEFPDGPGLIDWQLIQRGCWSQDLAYHIGAVLTVADREKSERDLINHYLSRLHAHGVTPPSADEAWLLYRMSGVYGYFLWCITQKVIPEITEEFTLRLGSLVAAHDSFGLLGV